MKKRYLSVLAILSLLSGCDKPLPHAPQEHVTPKEICPIHNVAFKTGPGKLPDGMTVSWTEEMDDAMKRYPYVRHNTWESTMVQYCKACETEVDQVMGLKRKNFQPGAGGSAESRAP
jgi:PBP1b-binding outer membrane lipoprotein LpoB